MKYYAIAEDCYVQALNDEDPDRNERYQVVIIRLGLYGSLDKVQREIKELNRNSETHVYTRVELKVEK
jgi:hypothetical protein